MLARRLLLGVKIIARALFYAAMLSAIGCGKSPSNQSNHEKDRPQAVQPPEGALTVLNAVWSNQGNFQMVGNWYTEGASTTTPDGNRAHELDLYFYDQQGVPLVVQDLTEVKPWMSIHGHGTATKKMTLSRDGANPALWHIGHIRFVMAGPWEVFVTATILPTDNSAGALPQTPVADTAMLKVDVL